MERSEIIEGKVDWKGRPAIKGKHGGMPFALLSISTFSFENMATIALATNLVTYLTEVMHFDVANSANQITNYMGTSYILSILIAFLADMFIGRPKSVLISACFEIVGLGLLAIQARSSKLKPPPCNLFDPTAHCTKVGGKDAVILFGGLYLVAIGSSGIKASLPSHGADQFEEKDPKEARQMSSFFNWFLLSGNIGSVASLTLIVWIQDNKGWDWAFGISSIGMVIGALLFISGLPRYRVQVIQKSNPLIEIIQVYIVAFCNRNLHLPEDPEELYEINRDKEAAIETEFLPHRDVYKFLDKAAIQVTPITQDGKPNPWKICRVTQVENAKIILGVLPIFCCAIVMTLCLAQLQTFSIQQAVTMDTRLTKHFHIPPASLAIIPIIFLLGLVPIYDRFFVPFARRITGHPTGVTHLQRIGVGLVLSCLSMAVAGLIEVKRKQVARKQNMLDAIPVIQPLPISVFWLSFQFFIFGIADLFSFIGLLEFFYSQAPKGIKSISTCFLWCSMALGYFLSTIIVNIVNSATKGITKSRGWLAGNNINTNHLNLFYWLLSLLSFLNFLVYLYVAKRYKYKPIVQEHRGPTNSRVTNADNTDLEDIEVQE
ncbi:protein NRT1/ PTR FAMILY 4.5-like [Rhododendron vialii]|uniref:protein NRT1/ PTR FAMILY 4.5-like n=1 Tax=Rhododendron vialii TaxID=182163 RepID=UPI00265FA5B0|nr:protein NRT1/ PTR FAMILY 4.5-like [Rhododendron vialii]